MQLELATKVLNVFREEGLWISTTDKDGNVTIQRQKISDEQHKTAINNSSKLDKNGMSAQDKQDLEKKK